MADLFLNDDWYHGGAFMLAHTFDSAPVYQPQAEPTPPPKVTVPFDYGTNVRHEFFLKLGTLGNATRRRAWRCTRCRRCKTTFVSDCFA